MQNHVPTITQKTQGTTLPSIWKNELFPEIFYIRLHQVLLHVE
jgi:hypothetical protein